MKKNKKEKWELAYYISTIIIAFFAIAGFIYAVISSNETSKLLNKTSETLQSFQDGMNSFTTPVIYLDSYDWTRDKLFDCEHPPNGIVVNFGNGSNIPIKTMYSYLTFGLLINNKDSIINIKTLVDNNETVIIQEKTWGSMLTFNNNLQNIFINKTGAFTPPLLTVRFNGVISNLSESVAYEVQIAYLIQYDCNAITQRGSSNIEKRYKLLSKEELQQYKNDKKN